MMILRKSHLCGELFMNQRHRQLTRSGFTLIELLVVIAIISILAAILFPVFARARENARRASCMSNLKQITLGFMQYTQDYDEKFPPALWEDPLTYTDSGSGSGSHSFIVQSPLDPSTPAGRFNTSPSSGSDHYYSWMDFIFPYVKSLQLFECPSFHVGVTGTAQNGAASYGYNAFISGIYGSKDTGTGLPNANSFPSMPPLSLATLQRASEIVLTLDYPVVYGTGAKPNTYCSTQYWLNPNDQYYNLAWPHLDGASVGFADGHVKWFKRGSSSICRIETGAGSTIAGRNQRAWNPWLP